jgi:DNA-binding response OmpR family regulator
MQEEFVTPTPDVQAAISEHQVPPTILVVDDSRLTATSLAKVLSAANYATAVALNGGEALECAKSAPISAAVIDIHLPDINGLVLSQRLRQLMGPNKPIIILSGDSSMEVINSLPHVGATYFFSKPVNVKELLQRLKLALGDGETAN